ncbi:MAG: tRNA uridine-5-carboxymethylaminomethyl(34) synthesis GTPase MnmE [Clostridia bacterium]|nr:tRNA uridine-5-carboxymethylaminomethyl(34) synthesis GTPase MnmE [Clostridia bacterium]
MFETDTIAAISTPSGTGGIGIIRISGDKAFEIARKIFEGKRSFDSFRSHTINYGKIVDPSTNETIDEVLLSRMDGPNTFTREDVIEINCHGGIAVQKRIIELVVREGARIAEPGEFTKRAFLNGRIDLTQAEAVIDLINSKTEAGSRAAVDQLEGKLSEKLKEVRKRLIELIAHIEVTVDYPEHDIEEITGQKIYEELNAIGSKLNNIIKNFDKGRIIREGISVVIVGRPNVGKSSLLNELSGKNKAIVTDIPGTTRDIIEEYVNIEGIPVKLIDTAGIRQTEDVVEKIGVEKARKSIESADLVIMMVDAGSGINSEDLEIMKAAREICNRKLIVLINKIDVADETSIKNIENTFDDVRTIRASIKEEKGIEELERAITESFVRDEIKTGSEMLVTNVRHKSLIDKAINNINDARTAFESGMPLDCLTIDIKNAAEHIGQITGESVSEDVMKSIFSRFCLGK